MNKNTIKKATEQKANEIKKFIENHKELQQEKVTMKDLNRCAKECGCHYYYVMQVMRFGKIVHYETIENGKLKEYRF